MALAIVSPGVSARERVVRREAAEAEVVQPSADFLRVRERPAEVRRVKLDDLVADLCDRAQRVGQVASELTANGVELDADGVLFRRLRGEAEVAAA